MGEWHWEYSSLEQAASDLNWLVKNQKFDDAESLLAHIKHVFNHPTGINNLSSLGEQNGSSSS